MSCKKKCALEVALKEAQKQLAAERIAAVERQIAAETAELQRQMEVERDALQREASRVSARSRVDGAERKLNEAAASTVRLRGKLVESQQRITLLRLQRGEARRRAESGCRGAGSKSPASAHAGGASTIGGREQTYRS